MHDQENRRANDRQQEHQEKYKPSKQQNSGRFCQHHVFHKLNCKFFVPSVTDEKPVKGYTNYQAKMGDGGLKME
jgi:hypothetical protein